MSTNFLWNPGTSNNGLVTSAVSLLTTELNGLTNTSYVVSSVGGTSGLFDNSSFGQAIWAEVSVTLGAIGTAVVAGGNLAGWFLSTYDGTAADGEQTSVVPPRPPDFIIPLPATTISAGTIWKGTGLIAVPALKFKVGIQNNTGQTLAATANVIRVAPSAMNAV